MANLDLLLVHPGSGRAYGDLPADLVAIEPPLWCRLIAGYVEDRGFSVRIIDAEAEGFDATKVALEAFGLQPQLVCICAYGHQPSASTQQMESVYAIARAVRSVASAYIVAVGGHVAALPDRTLDDCDAIDYVCAGEGPETIVEFLQGKRADRVPGLVWRSNGAGHYTKNPGPPQIDNLSQLHGDAWHMLPMRKYRAHNWQCLDNLEHRQPYASIYTSLGCPFACSFCCINAPFGGRGYRMRDPFAVVDEIVELRRRHSIRTFKIVDEMFVLNERHYTTICENLIPVNKNDDLNIWAYSRVDTIRTNKLELLRRAGVRWLALGIESESAYVRDGVDKRLKRDDIAGIVASVQAAGINVIANYIFGLPDDDMDSMRRTLRMAMDLRTEWANFYSAMAYPGSPLYAESVKIGRRLPERWDGYSQHGYESRPLDTQYVDGASVLKFRDEAFQIYFSSHQFLDDTGKKFGNDAVAHVRQMIKRPLPRKIVEQTYAPTSRASAQ